MSTTYCCAGCDEYFAANVSGKERLGTALDVVHVAAACACRVGDDCTVRTCAACCAETATFWALCAEPYLRTWVEFVNHCALHGGFSAQY